MGFQIGTDNYFVSLSDVSEVIPVPTFVTVPQTQSWFRGVSNVRGKLYSTIDFSAFQGGTATTPSTERRVILVHEKLIEGSGSVVDDVRSHMKRYRDLAAQGKWSDAGRELEAIETLLKR